MRQLLRRLAVSALLAPVAAIGVTTLITSPAQASASKPGPSQPGSWLPGSAQDGTWLLNPAQPGTWFPGTSIPGTSQPGSSQPGSWMPDSGQWKSNPWKSQPGSRKPRPWTPGSSSPTQPTQPTTPVPAQPTPAQPTPAQPAPTTPAPNGGTPAKSNEQTLQTEINRLINVQRTSNGCAALTVNDQLTTAARDHSAWMAQTGTFSHTGSGGSSFVTRAKAAGYAKPSAENIAMGYRSAAQVVDGWMNSPGHRANIVNCQSKTVGVGVVFAADGSPYYTQVFGY
ncbi:CAP domain-containing protein [Actinoplanes derwentensis]|uniref:Uncharacterized conserved protein YkwD, contains CAP (CSP/antigen 5/PR1) domain n=1 Tax=Actinoplanes derwentensis TaxID=113562 RepID=A0A1H1YRZ3_9ACTN|nr:CAP domain-containing protein [Actinoplanes derwentensis]GID81266.1 hypothetical protein Ade03nite_01900 [Actinoplanes derwentensis]SDT24285.1 Uncharacterized conserved protein YkwD, contains CAP (CSP/antigen 5/PR1) domain [Actinoplanes derwentensis]